MDNVTITILVLLSFLLVWVGIMIFTTKPEEEEVVEEEAVRREVVEMPEQNELSEYKRIVAELENKIRQMEAQPTNDTLLTWLTELRRDNEFLKMKLAHLEGGGHSLY